MNLIGVLFCVDVFSLTRPTRRRSILFFSSPNLARHVSGQLLTVAGGMEGRRLWDDEAVDVAEVLARL